MPFYSRIILLFFTLVYSNQTIGQSINLKIIGENELNTVVIDSLSYNKSFNDYISLVTEVERLKHKLTKHGYIDTSIDSITKQNDSLFEAKLYLGDKVNRIRIYLKSNFKETYPNLINNTKSEDYIDLEITELESYLDNLNAEVAELGDPFSTLQLINLSKLKPNLIIADLKIVNNQKRRIDNIIIKGYNKFPKSYVKHFLKLKTGKSFNLNAIKKKVELLNELRFASKIKDPEVLFTQDSTTLYIYVEKTKTKNFDGFLGFGTNENTNKIEFDGY
jgi:outer membrane protein assembly factor BamA